LAKNPLKIYTFLVLRRIFGENLPFYGFSTKSPTFPHRFSTLGVKLCGKVLLFRPSNGEIHLKTFTFSTVFSTEKLAQTLDLTGFSPFFDQMFFPHFALLFGCIFGTSSVGKAGDFSVDSLPSQQGENRAKTDRAKLPGQF